MVLDFIIVALTLAVVFLAGYVLLQESTIRDFKKIVEVQTRTERRLVGNVRMLQEELVHQAAVAQILTMWRARHEVNR